MDKLGIYIPTRNRAEELEECLRSFIPQIREYKLPIYIADSSETDATRICVERIKKEYQKIFYKKNTPAEGKTYAAALKSVLSMGKTKFVWFFGDDDTIKRGAIRMIMNKLNTNDYLQINAEVLSQDMKRCIKSRIIQKYKNETYKNQAELALLNMKNTGYQGFMAHMIIKKEDADNQIRKLNVTEPHMDFLHTIIFYRAISVSAREGNSFGTFIATPLINNRAGNWSYSSRVMDIFFKSWSKTHDKLIGYYNTKVLKIVRKLPIFDLMIMITMNKIMNKTQPIADYRKYILHNDDFGRIDKVILLMAILAPKILLKTGYNLYKLLKGINRVNLDKIL
ncbi:MAG: glycosyltransferase family A protein [Thermoplasmata archaeon]